MDEKKKIVWELSEEFVEELLVDIVLTVWFLNLLLWLGGDSYHDIPAGDLPFPDHLGGVDWDEDFQNMGQDGDIPPA